MNALICELCGSNELVKQNGLFVCQSCGTKYSVEEAKKLLGVIKVDKTEETEKLLVLARRAREENNSENAEKYYGLVLQNDPNNWEASFFQVYYQSMQCKIMNIDNAAQSVANNIDTTIKLISKMQDENAKKDALDTVISYSSLIASMFSNAAQNHYNQHSSVEGALDEYRDRVIAAYYIHQILEETIKKYFSSDSNRLITVLKAKNRFLTNNMSCFNEKYYVAEATRLDNEIKMKDPSYVSPAEQRVSSGCYVATAVYGSYDCPQVWTLRRYRDYTLAETWHGRLFVHTYYAVSPTLVKWFGNTEWFRNFWKPKLDRMVEKLNREGVEDTPYNDRTW